MVPVARKRVAMLLIMLLSVHEVAVTVRIREQQRSRAADLQAQFESFEPTVSSASGIRRGCMDGWQTERGECLQDVEAAWQAENEECGSQHPFLSCAEGPEHPTKPWMRRCASQPLLGDAEGSNEGCGVTDDWMLAGNPDKSSSLWLSMQISLLNATSTKLVESCRKGSPMYSEQRCRRQMQHVWRAINFVGKASRHGSLQKLTRDEKTKAQDALDDARKKVASIVLVSPKKQLLVNRVVESLKNVPSGWQKSPKARMADALKLLLNILPDHADVTSAEVEVQRLELEATQAGPVDTEAFDANMKKLEGKREHAPTCLVDTMRDTFKEVGRQLVEAEPHQPQNNLSETSSFIQHRSGIPLAVTCAGIFVAIVVILVAINLMVAVVYLDCFLHIICEAAGFPGMCDRHSGVLLGRLSPCVW